MPKPLRVLACATAMALVPLQVPAHAQEKRKSHSIHDRRQVAKAMRTARVMRWKNQASEAVRFARNQRGKPYVYGGTGPGSYDCSGLVFRAWRRAGVSIPRVADDQYRGIDKKIRKIRSLRSGDLVFFHGLGHVGIYTGNKRFIHSPRSGTQVRTQRLTGYYQRQFVGAARPAWPRALD